MPTVAGRFTAAIRADLAPLSDPAVAPKDLAALADAFVEAAEAATAALAAIAYHRSTPQATLGELAGVDSPRVRGQVAENPNTPQEVLADLLGSSSAEVRSGLARNTAADAWLLEQLAEDVAESPHDAPAVLLCLARNPAATERVLQMVADHPLSGPLSLGMAGIHPNASAALAASDEVKAAIAEVAALSPGSRDTAGGIDV